MNIDIFFSNIVIATIHFFLIIIKNLLKVMKLAFEERVDQIIKNTTVFLFLFYQIVNKKCNSFS